MVCACACLALSLTANSQQEPLPKRYIPPELQASDQEIRQLLSTAASEAEAGQYESALGDSKAALELAEKKGLVGDRAIAEEVVAIEYATLGKLDDALRLYRESLQHAIDSSNAVLEADVLVSLSTWPQMQGNLAGALELITKAFDAANRSQNLLVKSRVLGELGRLQVASGQVEAGRKSIEGALNIDKVNGYAFEPLHSVYAANALLSLPEPDYVNAVTKLESARDLAIKNNDYSVFVSANTDLANIYIRKREPQKGIEILEPLHNGRILPESEPLQMPKAFAAAVTQPLLKAELLEVLARAYGTAQQPTKALQIWSELYSFSQASGFVAAGGEAALEMGKIYQNRNDLPAALNYFSISSEVSRRFRLDWQLSYALSLQSGVLITMKKGDEAIPLLKEILGIANRTNDRRMQVVTDGLLATLYQSAGKLQEARSVLEEAQALIRPGPGDSEIDGKVVLETYGRLADVYKALQLPIKELVAYEKWLAVFQTLKDVQSLQQSVVYINKRFETLQVHDLATKASMEGRLAEALWYSDKSTFSRVTQQTPTLTKTGIALLTCRFSLYSNRAGQKRWMKY